MLHIDTIKDLAAAAEYLRLSGLDKLADAIDAAVLLNDIPRETWIEALADTRRDRQDQGLSA
jgi:hypothetical protein